MPLHTPLPARTSTKTRQPAIRPGDGVVPRQKPEKIEVRNVLERAASDPAFIAQLTYNPTEALAEYNLSQPARAALVSGDLRWIETRLGRLDARLRTWIDCRLQQEIW